MTGVDAEIPQEAQDAFWLAYNEALDRDPNRRTAAGLRAAFALMPAPVFVITDEVLAAASGVLTHSTAQTPDEFRREIVRTAAEAAGFRVEDRARR
jgi:predicted methyltransferase